MRKNIGTQDDALTGLDFLTLVYLLVPWIVFALSWLSIFPSLFIIGLVLTVLVFELLRIKEAGSPTAFQSALSLIVLCLWLGCAGVGGLGAQEHDWIKHNFFLSELSSSKLPPCYHYGQGKEGEYFSLSYSIGYYLPASLIGRYFGWFWANAALLAWTAAGVFLAFLQLFKMLPNARWSILLFPLLGGLDVIGKWLMTGSIDWNHSMEWWTKYQYSGNTTLLYWVPQHALPAWLATPLILKAAEEKRSNGYSLLIVGAAALWSAFVMIGLTALAALAALRTRGRGALCYASFVGITLLCVMAVYLSSNLRDFPIQIQELSSLAAWKQWALFCVLEFGVYALLLMPQMRELRMWLMAAAAVLLLLPVMRIGIHNDLVMRASIPYLYIIWILVLRELAKGGRRWPERLRRLFLGTVIFIGTFGSIGQIRKSSGKFMTFSLPEYRAAYKGELNEPLITQAGLGNYLADPDTVFFRYLSYLDCPPE
ncbi:MAG: hypothetical protein J5J00_02935 [Deltaproteobacteria bacterium]|nr:hypothetical protein [Deltaproteobacteria bacterium]